MFFATFPASQYWTKLQQPVYVLLGPPLGGKGKLTNKKIWNLHFTTKCKTKMLNSKHLKRMQLCNRNTFIVINFGSTSEQKWWWVGALDKFVYLSSCLSFSNCLSLLAIRISNLSCSSFIIWSCACILPSSLLDSLRNFPRTASASFNGSNVCNRHYNRN